jgi:hypothetical protein
MPPSRKALEFSPNSPPVEITIHDEMRWPPVMPKPGREKVVARYCECFRVATYLPPRRRTKRYQRRMVATWMPMFPGHVFVPYSLARPAELVKSCKIIHNVGPASEPILVEGLAGLQKKLEPLARGADRRHAGHLPWHMPLRQKVYLYD